MHRSISDYKITKRKDGRYYVRLQDGGEITHIYGKTKSEVQAKLDIKIEELNILDRRRTEQAFPTRNITLANWAHLCLNTLGDHKETQSAECIRSIHRLYTDFAAVLSMKVFLEMR